MFITTNKLLNNQIMGRTRMLLDKETRNSLSFPQPPSLSKSGLVFFPHRKFILCHYKLVLSTLLKTWGGVGEISPSFLKISFILTVSTPWEDQQTFLPPQVQNYTKRFLGWFGSGEQRGVLRKTETLTRKVSPKKKCLLH